MGEKVSGNASNEKYKMTIKLLKICSRTIKNLPKKIRSNVIISCFSVQSLDIDHNKRPLAKHNKQANGHVYISFGTRKDFPNKKYNIDN